MVAELVSKSMVTCSEQGVAALCQCFIDQFKVPVTHSYEFSDACLCYTIMALQNLKREKVQSPVLSLGTVTLLPYFKVGYDHDLGPYFGGYSPV